MEDEDEVLFSPEAKGDGDRVRGLLLGMEEVFEALFPGARSGPRSVVKELFASARHF